MSKQPLSCALLTNTPENLSCQVIMGYGTEFRVSHDAGEYLLVALHAFYEELIKYALHIGGKICIVVGTGRLRNVLIVFSACTYLVEK